MDGILVGCDSEQEWLLPWWYQNLRKHNPEIPIAFGDLGLTKKGRNWCQKRGILIPASQIPTVSPRSEDQPRWEFEGKRWQSESPSPIPISFRKPLLMKKSPFQRTLWLDLDCEVTGPLSPLFEMQLPWTKFGVKIEPTFFRMHSADKKECMNIHHSNSGVVLFEEGSPLLNFWVDFTNIAYEDFKGDDFILAFIVSKYHLPVAKIPFEYNWQVFWGPNPKGVVFHWVTRFAKEMLKLQIDSKSTISFRQFPILALEEMKMSGQR